MMTAAATCAATVTAAEQNPRVSCPLRVVTTAADVTASPQTAGFQSGFDKDNSMAFLMAVGLYAGPPSPATMLKPSASKGSRIEWTVQSSQEDIYVGCRYEAGVILARAVGRPVKTCSATVKQARGPQGEPWSLESAVVTCR